MNESELEDIESHLYSQVYHSNEGIEQDFHTLSFEILQRPEENMRKPQRYFQNDAKNIGSKFQNKHVLGKQSNIKGPLPNDYNQPEGFYSKNCTRPHKRDISINQLVVLSSPQRPLVCMASSNRQIRKAQWKAKVREKKKRKAAQKLINLQNVVVGKQVDENVKCDIITLSDTDDESCIEIKNDWPIVSVIDSDDEGKTVLKQEKLEKLDDITPKSDDNVSTKTPTDDVIFVEPDNAPIEVINIDEEGESSVQKNNEVNPHADVETASHASSNNSFINSSSKPKSPKHLHQERKELLSTPDSASNDFMNYLGVETNQYKFNFSLHGIDFNNREFLKPANPTDTCETESSSSTTDTINVMKTAVFNEIEFPKEDIFLESNLETFGNFITPLRKGAPRETVQSSTPIEKVTNVLTEDVNSSDSSSESDFEETIEKQRENPKKHKNLPYLSPMLSETRNISPQTVKKSKKVSNLSSKYDLINSMSSEPAMKVKQKKRKSHKLIEALNTSCEAASSKKKNKNKKKKTEASVDSSNRSNCEENLIDSTKNMEENFSRDDINKSRANSNDKSSDNLTGDNHVENETKQKKRKSSQMVEDTNESSESNQSKKKSRHKKKKADGASFTQDIELNGSVSEIADPEQDFAEKAGQSSKSETDFATVSIASEIPSLSEVPVRVEDGEVELQARSDVLVAVEENCGKLEQKNVVIADSALDVNEKTEHQAVENMGDGADTGTYINQVVSEDVQNGQDALIGELIVIDEVYDEDSQIVLSSDSESNLSELHGPVDIQLLNCQQPKSFENTPTVSTEVLKTAIDLSSASTEEVQHTMSNDPKLWSILDSDRMPYQHEDRRKRCNKCREKGHMAIRCPNKVVPKCNLCGDTGHYEPRCPNRICTQCGHPSTYSTTYCKYCFKFRNQQCQLCSMVGHAAQTCPDLWRRYYLTTAEGPLTVYDGPILKPKNELWCSGCARSGHLEYTCRYYKSHYPPSDPHIKSYENVYENGEDCIPKEPEQVAPPLQYGINAHQGPQFSLNSRIEQERVELYRHPINYNRSNFVINPLSHNSFRPMYPANQRNWFESRGLFQHPARDNYLARDGQGYTEYCFEDNLPNFISFESTPTDNNYREVTNFVTPDNQCINVNNNIHDVAFDVADKRTMLRWTRRSNGVFFSSSVENIQYFINEELQRLTRLSYQTNKIVKNLKKNNPAGASNKMGTYYETLNMVLFGILNLNDGKFHLDKLKKFKTRYLKAKLSQIRRQELYRSYCYIFGNQKHGGVDYNELLRRI